MLRKYCYTLCILTALFICSACSACSGRDVSVQPKGQAIVGVGGGAHMNMGVGF